MRGWWPGCILMPRAPQIRMESYCGLPVDALDKMSEQVEIKSFYIYFTLKESYCSSFLKVSTINVQIDELY